MRHQAVSAVFGVWLAFGMLASTARADDESPVLETEASVSSVASVQYAISESVDNTPSTGQQLVWESQFEELQLTQYEATRFMEAVASVIEAAVFSERSEPIVEALRTQDLPDSSVTMTVELKPSSTLRIRVALESQQNRFRDLALEIPEPHLSYVLNE